MPLYFLLQTFVFFSLWRNSPKERNSFSLLHRSLSRFFQALFLRPDALLTLSKSASYTIRSVAFFLSSNRSLSFLLVRETDHTHFFFVLSILFVFAYCLCMCHLLLSITDHMPQFLKWLFGSFVIFLLPNFRFV